MQGHPVHPAEAFGRHVLIAHRVLKTEQRGIGRDFVCQLFERHRGIVGLDGQEHDIVGPEVPLVKRAAGGRLGHELPVAAKQFEPIGPDFIDVRPVADEQHLGPGLAQVRTDDAADRSRPKDDKTHTAFSFARVRRRPSRDAPPTGSAVVARPRPPARPGGG